MAIYIDKHIYSEECDKELIFKYLYFLISMLAFKSSYFNKQSDYEDFSIFAASYVYEKLTDKKRFDEKLSEHKRGPKYKQGQIKSSLNYIKSTLSQMKAMYLLFLEKEKPHETSTDTLKKISSYNILEEYENRFKRAEYLLYVENIPNIIKDTIKKIVHFENPFVFENIYISCLFSFLNLITLSKKDKERIKFYKDKIYENPNLIYYLFDKQRNDIILWHLDNSYSNIIKLILNNVKMQICNELGIADRDTFTINVTLDNLTNSLVEYE